MTAALQARARSCYSRVLASYPDAAFRLRVIPESDATGCRLGSVRFVVYGSAPPGFIECVRRALVGADFCTQPGAIHAAIVFPEVMLGN